MKQARFPTKLKAF